jgi:signal transduction histidine kinase
MVRRHAFFLWLGLLTIACIRPLPAQDAVPLSTAAAVRRLPPDEAARGRPVSLRGTLLLVTRQRDALVLRDETDGIYIELAHTIGDARRPGNRLEVEGVTGAGDFAPMIRARRITWTGAGPLPEPRPTALAELNAGGFDAAWIELEGIVRSCDRLAPDGPAPVRGGVPAPELWALTLAQGDDRMTVQLRDRVIPEALVDAKVRLRGVVFNVHNANRQFVRANVQVANLGMVSILTPPPPDPFAQPLQRIDEILRFTPAGFTGHRIHVRGVVTAHHHARTVWLQDGDRGLRVATEQAGELAPGDEIEVVGFADHGGYAPGLSDARFRKIRAGAAPRPVLLRAADEIARQDSNLVQIEARVDEMRSTPDGPVLVLRWGESTVGALLPLAPGETAVPAWEPGSRVRATGICVPRQPDIARPSGLWVADQMQLLLRSPADVTVTAAAPWLNNRRALWLAIAVATFVLLALVAVAWLARRQIAQREEARKLAEVEFAAMLAERNRLARELHDTIAQELNAVSMQMELAKNSARTRGADDVMPHLVTAHGIVRGCLAEVRESIWDMRSHILEKNDLPGALRAVAEQLGAGRSCAITTQVHGQPRRLAPMLENNLLRIGQEAVANALKHARPDTIAVELHFETARVRLQVRDDGSGFEPAAPHPPGHFGLRGIGERVEQMNAELSVRRGPGGGTVVEVAVPVSAP